MQDSAFARQTKVESRVGKLFHTPNFTNTNRRLNPSVVAADEIHCKFPFSVLVLD